MADARTTKFCIACPELRMTTVIFCKEHFEVFSGDVWFDHRESFNHWVTCKIDNCPECDRIVSTRPWLLEEYEESLRASDKA